MLFVTREAEKGWRDLVATARNAAVNAWDFLTVHPTQENGNTCYRLTGKLAIVRISGIGHQRWQYKPTGGGRIWYAVIEPHKDQSSEPVVLIERVTTGHPNQTIKTHR